MIIQVAKVILKLTNNYCILHNCLKAEVINLYLYSMHMHYHRTTVLNFQRQIQAYPILLQGGANPLYQTRPPLIAEFTYNSGLGKLSQSCLYSSYSQPK